METVVRTLAEATGHEDVRIFCCEGAKDHNAPGVEGLPSGPGRRRVLLEKLHAFRPQVIEHHQRVRNAMPVAAAMPEAAHVLYRHSALKAPQNRFEAWRYNARYAAFDGFVFVSSAERALFTGAYPQLAGKAWALPNPINAEPWLAPIEGREPLIGFAGRAMPEKGLGVICATLPAILDRRPDWRAVLMLNDWEQHQHWAAPQVAKLAGYGDRVTILRSAPLAEVQRQMRRVSIALTPSLWSEPFGLTAVEAHAAGAALISSGRGGLREASGPHALYLDEVTRPTLEAAIEHLICHPVQRLEMARSAQRYVLDVHGPQKRAEELLRIRRQIVWRKRMSEQGRRP